MIYIETGSTDVYFNFGLEYYFTAVKKLEEPVFLFWRTSPTLMVGKYQNTLEEINDAYAKEHGIQVVRRMSGGGTIYTDPGGWQYTFIDYGADTQIHFQEYIAPVIEGLRSLGMQAEFNGRNDLLVDGKKISGNAQYKLAGSTVHHGSLLVDTDIEQMVKSTTVDEYKIISKSIKSVRDRVTNIREHMSHPVDALGFKERMIHCIMRGSEKQYVLNEEDKKAIEAIADERFRSWESKYGSNPKFSMERTGRFTGGKITFLLDIKKGIISSAQVFGDFFATEAAEKIGGVLQGCRLDSMEVYRVLKEAGLDHAVYGIDAKDMTEVVTGVRPHVI